MNNQLKNVHQLLMAQHQALYDKLDSVTDPALAKTLVTEMQEILHRIVLTRAAIQLTRIERAAHAVRAERVEDRGDQLR